MSTDHSRRIPRVITALFPALAIFPPLNPAWARVAPLNSQEFDFNQLLSDPLNLVIIGTLVLAFIIGAFVVLRKSPNLADAQRAKEEYLSALPVNTQGYKAVLYEDEVQGLYLGVGGFYNHRILVELTHGDPAKSKTLFHNEETPSMTRAIQREESERAVKLWIREAGKKGLPAVYTTKGGTYKLEEGHFSEMAEDPGSFIKKLQSFMQIRRPLPAPHTQ